MTSSAKACVTDNDCYVDLINTAINTGSSIFIPKEASMCYIKSNDENGHCYCNKFWRWNGDLCNQVSTATVANSLMFVIPLSLSAVFFMSRLQIVLKLIRNKLFILNSSGVSIITGLSSLFLNSVLSVLYVISYFYPQIELFQYIRIGDYIVMYSVIISILSLSFTFESLTKSAFEVERRLPKIIALVFSIGLLIGLTVLAYEGNLLSLAILFAACYFSAILWFLVSGFSLFIKFSDSFRRGVTRREQWREKRFGSILIGIDIVSQVAKHTCCGVDVAAGRHHSDIIREADENSSQRIGRVNSVGESMQGSNSEHDVKPTLIKSNKLFSSSSKLNRDSSSMDSRSQRNLSANWDGGNESDIRRKHLSYGNKKLAEKFISFLVRIFYVAIFVIIFWVICMVSEQVQCFNFNVYEPVSKNLISEAVAWRCVLLLTFTFTANICLWCLEEASRNRLKAKEDVKNKRNAATTVRNGSHNSKVSNPRGVEAPSIVFTNTAQTTKSSGATRAGDNNNNNTEITNPKATIFIQEVSY